MRPLIVVVGVILVVGAVLQSFIRQRKAAARPRFNVRYSVEIFERSPAGLYRPVGKNAYFDTIPSDAHQLERLGGNVEVQIRGINLDTDTATFALTCRNEEQTVVASRRGADLTFDDGAIKITVTLKYCTVPPFTPDDDRLKSPVVAYKLDSKFDMDVYAPGEHVLKTMTLSGDDIRSELLDIMSDEENLQIIGADCFDPGMAFRCGDVYIVICLECNWLRIFGANASEKYVDYGLSKTGASRLRKIYERLW